MIRVLDAGPLIAYLEGEPGDPVVDALLSDPNETCYVHAVNLCEVYYHAVRGAGKAAAQAALAHLAQAGLAGRDDMDPDFWEAAGDLKARYARISLADCFALTLAARLGGELVTTDHGEMDALVAGGPCPIRFIR